MISVKLHTALYLKDSFNQEAVVVNAKYGPAFFKDDVTVLDVFSYFGCEEMADDMYLCGGYRWGTRLCINGNLVCNTNRGNEVVKNYDTDECEHYFVSLIERADPG